ncbi:MAG: GNAT family N-acetyltransferase [Alphaproteobacteria bacterium]|nr:MAG: GNAT family N-acetyltransferase [Alphaproteobacteria bacterium]
MRPVESEGTAAGFLMSRQAIDEEEVLLIAVRPDCRRRGIAAALLNLLVSDANQRGVTKLFLEMRENNPAKAFYLKQRFTPVGRRPNYYNRGAMGTVDAITFERSIEIAS